MKQLCCVLFLAAFTLPSFAQEAPLWMRYPAISPDGQTIVFSYKGDLYRVPSQGGVAQPLTLFDGHDFMPVWSNDGQHIAFASNRHGNFDVYVMPGQGGRATRLTFHSSDDLPSTFSPNNQHILFSSQRLDAASSSAFPYGRMPELYQVAITGDQPSQVLTITAEYAQFSRDGSKLLYQDKKGGENEWRKHHTSSVTRDIWLYDTAANTYEQLTTSTAEDRNPVFTPDEQGFYYLSAENGTINVHRMDVGASANQQLTTFTKHPVRFLTMANDGLLCFSFDGEIYTMQEGTAPQKVDIHISIDGQYRDEETMTVSSGAREMAVSPNGKEIAFIYRGEVFVTSTETATTKQITQTPQQERSVNFSPDGRSLIYAAERAESWDLYQTSLVHDDEPYFFNATVLNEEPLLVSEAETFQPAYSPDGKEVAYLEERTTLKVINLATKQTRTIMTGDHSFSYADGDQHYQWSPDGKWFLVQYHQPGYWISEAGLVRSDGSGEVINLTESGFNDSRPQWMMGGKMMLWFSDRDGMRSKANTGSTQADAYGLFFTQDTYDRFRLNKEDFDLLKEAEGKAKKEKTSEDKDAKADSTMPDLTLDLDGFRDRKARLTIHSSRLSDAVVTPDGSKLLYLANFEKGYDLWQTDLRTQETKILVKMGGSGGRLALDKAGKNVLMLAGGRFSKVAIDSGKRTSISFNGEMVLHPAAERAYLFEHVWRQVTKKFYDADLHGAPWTSLKPDYARYLPHINNNYDYAEFLSELLGELNASHTGGRYGHRQQNADATASLGLFFDESYTGTGLQIAEVLNKGPFDKAESQVATGAILEQIDGTALTDQVNMHRLLNRKAGKTTRLSFFNPQTNTRWDETVKPITRGAEQQLLYQRWVNQRRAQVDELSNGRLGYVHVRSMSDPSYRTVYEEVMGRQATKEGIVVDTRFNGGGDLVDDLSTFLEGWQYMTFTSQDGRKIGFEPQRRWTKPSIVIVSEGNYSDAHCFPWAYKAKDIGKVVGMPVPGTCTFVWWERLQDNTLVFGIPNMAVDDLTGNPLENQQLDPDVRVVNEPGAVTQGRDQQLEQAVQELLTELDADR